MERHRNFEARLTNSFTPEFQVKLFEKIFAGEIELRAIDGTAWADTPEAEDILLEAMAAGHVAEHQRLPRRWAETTDLEAEGDISLDGTKKVFVVTPENLAGCGTLLASRPDGYDVTIEYLESLDYTALKNFIRRYKELDDELNLSSAKAVLLEATIEYFGLGMEMGI